MGQVLSLYAHLKELTCWAREGCGIQFAIPLTFFKTAQAHGTTFYCPRGHALKIGEGDVERLKRELESERKRKEWAEQDAKRAKHSASIARGKLKAQSLRVKNGVCPCCNRSFQNLRRHMETKHPEFGSVPRAESE